MNKYLIILEKTESGFSAYSPDLPGCIATGTTREEIEREMRAAIEFHIEGLRMAGYEVPQPKTQAVYCEIAA
jgi:predicted RNase H-like HicB family nuclease